jgi:hypothetical protein
MQFQKEFPDVEMALPLIKELQFGIFIRRGFAVVH